MKTTWIDDEGDFDAEDFLKMLNRIMRDDGPKAKVVRVQLPVHTGTLELQAYRHRARKLGFRTFASVQQFGEMRWYHRKHSGEIVGPFATEELALLDALRGPA